MRKLKTYTLRIMGPEPPGTSEPLEDYTKWATDGENAVNDIGGALSDAEDAVNDQLPDGFYCKIDGVLDEDAWIFTPIES